MKIFLKQKTEYWIEHPHPILLQEKIYFFVVYRNLSNDLAWREISQGEHILLELLKIGTNLTEACHYIELQKTSLYEDMAQHLQKCCKNGFNRAG